MQCEQTLRQISHRVTALHAHKSELSLRRGVLSQQPDGPSKVPLQLGAWSRLASVHLPSAQRCWAILENAALLAKSCFSCGNMHSAIRQLKLSQGVLSSVFCLYTLEITRACTALRSSRYSAFHKSHVIILSLYASSKRPQTRQTPHLDKEMSFLVMFKDSFKEQLVTETTSRCNP